LQTLNERIGTPVSDSVAGAVAFAGDLIVFVLTVVVFCLLGRIVVVPAVTRLLDARNVQPTLAKPAQKLTLAAVVFVAVAVGFAVAGFGNLLTPLAAIAVTLTLAIGFASQDVIGNPVAGVFLIADPKTRIGDWVEWDDRKGSIEDISFRVSRVRTFDSGLVTVPNSELANTAIVNPAAKDELRITFTFGVGDEDDLDHAQRVITGETENHDDILDEPAASTRVTELADSYVGIQSRFRIDAPSRADFARIRSEYVQYSKRPFLSVIGGGLEVVWTCPEQSDEDPFEVDHDAAVGVRVADEPADADRRAVREGAGHQRCVLALARRRAVPRAVPSFGCVDPQDAGRVDGCALSDLVGRVPCDRHAGKVFERSFGRLDHLAEGRLVAVLAPDRQRVRQDVHRYERRVVERAGRGPAKVAHVRARPQRQPEVVTELPDVGTGLAADAQEDATVPPLQQVEVVDRPDPEPPAHRGLPGWLLEQRPLELGDGRVQVGGRRAVEFEDGDVLLLRVVERLRGARRVTQQERERPRHLRVERAGVGRAVDPRRGVRRRQGVVHEVPRPGRDLMGGGAGGLVQVDDAERQ